MKQTDLERTLEQIRLPRLEPGTHQRRLRQALMNETQSLSRENAMSRCKALVASRQMRVVAASMVAVILVASGWAAEKVLETVKRQYHATETIAEQELPSLDGKGVWNTSITIGTAADDPEKAEAALQQHLETVKKSIAEKKYVFQSTFESPEGLTQYVYRFELPDGTEFANNFSMRLEHVASWDEYLQKVKQRNLERHQQIQTAVSARPVLSYRRRFYPDRPLPGARLRSESRRSVHGIARRHRESSRKHPPGP